jgi:CRP-like cAMP-binding protein
VIDPQHLLVSPFFRELCEEDELSILAGGAELLTVPAGYVLMSAGDFGAAMYVIVDGRLRVSVDDAGRHRRKEVAHLGRGDLVGEMALMTGDRRRATVTAETEVTVIRVTKTAFESLLARSPKVSAKLDGLLTRRTQELDQAVAALAEPQSLGERVASAVSRIARRRPNEPGA